MKLISVKSSGPVYFAWFMWYYLLVFISSFIVDAVPFAGPPAWTVMVFFQMRYHLNIWMVLILGVVASTIGRYTLSVYMPWLSERLIKKQKNDDLQFIGSKLAGKGWGIQLFVLLYTLMPLPSTPLFTVAGIARIKPVRIIPAFFVGKFTSDMVMVLTGNYVANNAAILARGFMTWQNITGSILGIIAICIFLFTDWRLLLQQRKFRLSFNIWK